MIVILTIFPSYFINLGCLKAKYPCDSNIQPFNYDNLWFILSFMYIHGRKMNFMKVQPWLVPTCISSIKLKENSKKVKILGTYSLQSRTMSVFSWLTRSNFSVKKRRDLQQVQEKKIIQIVGETIITRAEMNATLLQVYTQIMGCPLSFFSKQMVILLGFYNRMIQSAIRIKILQTRRNMPIGNIIWYQILILQKKLSYLLAFSSMV